MCLKSQLKVPSDSGCLCTDSTEKMRIRPDTGGHIARGGLASVIQAPLRSVLNRVRIDVDSRIGGERGPRTIAALVENLQAAAGRIGLAFAWVLLTLALGLTASQAHADDDNGLLGAVTSTVDDTTSTVTDGRRRHHRRDRRARRSGRAAGRPDRSRARRAGRRPSPNHTVAPVVESTVTPVVSTVSTRSPTLTESGVVAPIVDSTVGVVGAVPVVGEVVSGPRRRHRGLRRRLERRRRAAGRDGRVIGPVVGTVVDHGHRVVDTTTGAVIAPDRSRPSAGLQRPTTRSSARSRRRRRMPLPARSRCWPVPRT